MCIFVYVQDMCREVSCQSRPEGNWSDRQLGVTRHVRWEPSPGLLHEKYPLLTSELTPLYVLPFPRGENTRSAKEGENLFCDITWYFMIQQNML